MKIVVLDGYTLNPGDLSWQGLEALGEVKVYDRTKPEEVVSRAEGAEIVLTNKVPVSKDDMEQLPALKYIGVLATGYNIIDIEAAKQKNIVITNIPGYGTNSVVQLTFSFILESCFRVQRHSDSVREGQWTRSADFSYWNYPLRELTEKTLGIVGFGAIGQKVADVASAFGMAVIAYSRTETDQSHRRNFRWATLDHLLKHADFISLHTPLTPETQGLINADALKKMKKDAFLINTARGALVKEQELADALNEDRIAGAGLDVLSTEPPQPDNPLLSAKHCLITPHIAWATLEARTRLMQTAVSNLKAYLSGHTTNAL